MNTTLTALDGFRVGHAAYPAATGCTVILCPPGTMGGVDQRGGAPATRELDLLRPMRLNERVDAVLLSGGSAYGLDTAGGVMRWLEERGLGFDVGVGVVPIVPAACIFDLGVGGDPSVRPDAALGYAACEAASADPVAEGNVGAGAGATVGKYLGPALACKSGLGTALIALEDGLQVAALMVVNALGNVIAADGSILAGARDPGGAQAFVDARAILPLLAQTPSKPGNFGGNTVIGVVATNARLDKEETNKVAQMAHDGLARAVDPAHTIMDGDTIIALAGGSHGPANASVIGALAADATAQAIRRAVQAAESLPTSASQPGLPSAADFLA
ncbi:MAG: P1 family peptidase [Anaerolineae bacterium]|nr:P1 family peptidase [Anaerolineae bacterium]